MKIRLFCIVLGLCVFASCEKDEPVIPEEPLVPPTEQPEEPQEPGTPVEPENPQEPQKPISTDGIIKWNNEFIIVGDNNMALIGSGIWNAVAHGTGRYVAVGNSSLSSWADGYYTTSVDGMNWDAPKVLPDISGYNNGNGVVFGNGKFITSSRGGVHVSSDGTNWTPVCVETPLTSAPTWGRIVFLNGSFYLLDGQSGGGYCGKSDNGENWNVFETESFNTGIAHGNGKYVKVRNRNTANNPSYSDISYDGVNWSNGGIINDAMKVTDIAFGNGKFVAVSDNGKIASSTDGVNWSTTGGYSLYDVTYENEKFVAVGSSGSIAYSTDGVNWNLATKVTGATLYGICPVQ